MKFRYVLDSREKFDCPKCFQRNRFVKYRDVTTGEYLENGYGKCDRENNCGYWERPNNTIVKNEADIKYQLQRERHVTYSNIFPDNYYKYHRENRFRCDRDIYLRTDISHNMYRYPGTDEIKYVNMFLRGLAKRFGAEASRKSYDEFRLGTFYDGGVMFPFFNHNGKLITAKVIFYDNNLKRIKEGKKSYPRWLHYFNYMPDYEKYEIIGINDENWVCDIPFFGWDLDVLIKTDKTVGLVESEKTAIILSILIPEVIWMATGGLHNLQEYKFLGLNNKSWIVLPDMGFLPNKKITVKEHWQKKFDELKHKIDFKSILFPDYVPDASAAQKQIWESNGYDIADFILSDNHYRNNIKKILKIE